ncbi:MAG: rod shape-determining protein MreC [Gammaproteobacteria bacterium]
MALSTPETDQRGFRDPDNGLRFAVICALSLALMVADNRVNLLQDIRRVLAAVAFPLQVLVDSPAVLGRWLGETGATRERLLTANQNLRATTLEQSARLQRMAALEAENTRLRALLDSTAKVGDRVLIAEIMSVDMDPFRQRVVINKGSQDGAFVGQALIDADGVVGQITRDQIFSSEGILITDAEHALPVEVLRTRQRTLAIGTGQLDRLSIPFLPRNTDIAAGDLLVTSGLGGIFPSGYPVAVVSKVATDSGTEFLAVEAKPAAALSRVREVLLIWPGNPTPTDLPEPATEMPAERAPPESGQEESGPAAEPADGDPA